MIIYSTAGLQPHISEQIRNHPAFFSTRPPKLIAVNGDAKTVKGNKVVGPDGQRYVTGIMYLAPADMGGEKTSDRDNAKHATLCPMAELAQCKAPCLNSAGRGQFNSVQLSRLRKTLYFNQCQSFFTAQLVDEIEALRAKVKRDSEKLGVPIQLCIRLNGTSDIRWEHVPIYRDNGEGVIVRQPLSIMEMFPDVQFYDYTKLPSRSRQPFPNYDLTFSYSGVAGFQHAYIKAANKGFRMAAVVRNERAKQSRLGDANAYDGDEHDLTFLRPQGSVLLLTAKGKAKRDTSGFVID